MDATRRLTWKGGELHLCSCSAASLNVSRGDEVIQVLERLDPAVFQARLQVPRQPAVVRLEKHGVSNSTLSASFLLDLLALCRHNPNTSDAPGASLGSRFLSSTHPNFGCRIADTAHLEISGLLQRLGLVRIRSVGQAVAQATTSHAATEVLLAMDVLEKRAAGR
jgi:hypothetical protein